MTSNSSPYLYRRCEYGKPANPPALFLHGFTGNCYDWSDIATSLSDKHRCVAVDLPGHGRTIVKGEDENYIMPNVAKSLIQFLNSIDIERSDLVAYSMGGRLALYLVVHYPDVFTRVILESTSPGLRTEQERTERIKHDRELADRLLKIPFVQFIEKWYDQPLFATMKSYPERFQQMKNERMTIDPSGLARSLHMMGTGAQPSLWEKLSEIVTPVLLIVGEKDSKFRGTAGEMVKMMPAAEMYVANDAGHNVHWEKPDEVAKVVRDFLGK